MKQRVLFVLLSLALCAPASFAQLTVVTNQASYTVGEVVQITIHNAGPSAATFTSYPSFSIWHTESGDCVYGCAGLPEIWTLPVGGTVIASRGTDVEPDQPGHYDISLAGTSIDPGSILSAEYELMMPVTAVTGTWGGIKGLYR